MTPVPVLRHLLVTNDFPPKVGGIQSYLYELWRRLPPDSFAVLTTPHEAAAEFDAAQSFRIERTREPVLLPQPWLARHIDRLAEEIDASLIVLDPALPVGLIGPFLRKPYALVLHGAEVTIPGRIPVTRPILARALRQADRLIAAGGYPAEEARRAGGDRVPAITVVPPGVDIVRFRPLTADERAKGRADLGLPEEGTVVLGLSRLVPRKGFDVLIDAFGRVSSGRADCTLAIAGAGRDRRRLEVRSTSTGVPVQFLGRLSDELLPTAYACADVFVMLCRSRWAGLEQEGFGIVFVEAAACGVPSIAGASGGASEAVIDRETGYVVANPNDVAIVADRLDALLSDTTLRQRMGDAARARVVAEFDNDMLAARLADALSQPVR